MHESKVTEKREYPIDWNGPIDGGSEWVEKQRY